MICASAISVSLNSGSRSYFGCRYRNRKPDILEQAFTAAKNFKPSTQTQIAAILDKTKLAAMTGKFEKFKTDNKFDGAAKNPKWSGGMPKGI